VTVSKVSLRHKEPEVL